ncbi:MAG TPA: hypothetical protein PKN69_01165, partial [Candidatus Latescibacteria bacterium]|nr:hypothetical protein [Candidatus Latescibacterota bacterium]
RGDNARIREAIGIKGKPEGRAQSTPVRAYTVAKSLQEAGVSRLASSPRLRVPTGMARVPSHPDH